MNLNKEPQKIVSYSVLTYESALTLNLIHTTSWFKNNDVIYVIYTSKACPICPIPVHCEFLDQQNNG